MRNVRSASLAGITAAVAGVALAAGCSHAMQRDEASGDRPPTAREQCRMSFRACAPPASFAPDTDVKRLSIRKLVLLSARLDVADDLAESAAGRLQKVVATADVASLLELESSLDDVGTWYDKCRCKEFRSELEKRDVTSAVAARLPPRETRSPEHWVSGILQRIEEIRALRRRASGAVATGGESGAGDGGAGKLAEAERGLCEIVHAARGPLSSEAFAKLLEMVHAKVRNDAGDGSAEVAKRMLDEVKDSNGCE